jgi:hypothetical protein
MMLDSYTPQMEWRGRMSSADFNAPSSTRVLSHSSTLPRQEIIEDLEQSLSLWDESALKSGVSTAYDKRFRTVGPKISKPSSRQDEIVLLKKWDGFVSKVLEDGFIAQFEEDGQGAEALEAEFDLDELVDGDKEILTEGMPVIWCISRERANGGQKRCSTIYLRRQAAPREAEVSAAATSLDEWFNTSTASPGS